MSWEKWNEEHKKGPQSRPIALPSSGFTRPKDQLPNKPTASQPVLEDLRARDAFFKIDRSSAQAVEDYSKRYPRSGSESDGREVLHRVPNTDSISASLVGYEKLPGIRNVPMSEFNGPRSVFYAADDFARSERLARRIAASGEISPLIIVVDKEGPYILEGAHRYVALHHLGAKEFPALVVIDRESFDEGK